MLQRLVSAAGQSGERVPAALKFALARISDDRCLVPLQTLAEVRGVLDRIAPGDAQEVVADLARRAGEAVTGLPRPVLSTVSDLRRARRARGASLAAIGADTGIPVSLLRELEWGLFDNWWSSSGAGKTAPRVPDAAGLDPDAVSALVTTVPGKRARPNRVDASGNAVAHGGRHYSCASVGLPTLISSLPRHVTPSRGNAAAIAAERTSTVAVIDAPGCAGRHDTSAANGDGGHQRRRERGICLEEQRPAEERADAAPGKTWR